MIKYSTKNKSPWVNTCEYIVLHHTATWERSTNWLIELFKGNRDRQVSVHYLINEYWTIYKFGEDTDILWHAWVSSWKWKTNLNRYSIGIEIVWPLSDWGFNNKQIEALRKLIYDIRKNHQIKEENILRHKDISPWRKIDIQDNFWNKQYKTWEQFRKSLLYTEINWVPISHREQPKVSATRRGMYLPASHGWPLIILYPRLFEFEDKIIKSIVEHEYAHYIYFEIMSRKERRTWEAISKFSLSQRVISWLKWYFQNEYINNHARKFPSEDFAEMWEDYILTPERKYWNYLDIKKKVTLHFMKKYYGS